MTRDEAREKFKKSKLEYRNINRKNLQQLRNLMNDKMKESGCFNGTFRCKQRPFLRKGDQFFAGIRCKAFYFEDREAISFNNDGFIGFAGWADENNVQPILAGFSEWVDEMEKVLVSDLLTTEVN